MAKIPAKPSPHIPPGSDRGMTDKGKDIREVNNEGPDTSIIGWDGTEGIDDYEGPNRNSRGDSTRGEILNEGFEFEEESESDN